MTFKIINKILEKEKEIKEELEIISFMNMNIGQDVKLVKLRRHLRKSLEGAIKLTVEEVEHKHQVSMQCAREGAVEDFAEKLKEELDWTKIEDGSVAWSPGQVIIKIDDLLNQKSLSANTKEVKR